MTPTPEQTAAMDARGWTWDPDRRAFRACPPTSPLFATVRYICDGWYETHGGIQVAGGEMCYPEPDLAADAAEDWLRSVLAPFRFPWLTVVSRDSLTAAIEEAGPKAARAARTCWTCRWAVGRDCKSPAYRADTAVDVWIGNNIDWDTTMPLPTATPCPGFTEKL